MTMNLTDLKRIRPVRSDRVAQYKRAMLRSVRANRMPLPARARRLRRAASR